MVFFGAMAALLCAAADAPLKLSLAELSARTPPAFTPVYLGRTVKVRGVVNHTAYHFPEYTIIAMEDGRGGAAILKAALDDTRLDAFSAGEDIEVTGTVGFLAGTIVIQPQNISVLGRKPAPAAIDLSPAAVQDLKYLGRLVHLRGHLQHIADTAAGTQIFLDGQAKLFLPRPQDQPAPNFASFAAGDDIETTGVAHLYSVRKPFNRGFELLVHEPDLLHREKPWVVPPVVLASGICMVLAVAFLLWSRERRLGKQRDRPRKTYQLGEEILGAASATDIVKRIGEALPEILGITRVHLFVYNRSGRTLDEVTVDGGETVSIPLGSPPAGTRAGAAACFHYRTLLVIPDIDRSPFPMAGKEGERTPHSLLFVPMMAQGEVVGVLELDQDDRARDFKPDEQTLAQHLGNQIGVAIRLLDQRSVQEQLFRTEKLAAVGRLISGVVNELQTPLSSISELAQRALEKSHAGAAEREVAAIAAEARKAAGMVARLVSFAAAEQVEARPVSIGALLKNLIEFREGDWKASGIRVRDLTSSEPQFVLGSQGHLEQVFLNLLVHAEQSLAEAPQKIITVRTSVLAKRLLVEIAFSAPPGSGKPEETAAVLGVTRSVIAGHGGEVRLIEKANTEPRFEVELPVSSSKERIQAAPAQGAAAPADSARRLTGLVIEPDEAAQRQLLALLAARGYRVVPVPNADTGLELAHRMRFDAAFCSVHAPGLNWVELSERMHPRVGGFVLLSDGYDAELAGDFEGGNRFVLPKPVQEAELERVLRSIERGGMAKVIPIKDVVA
jgi:GAF domain-containing protein/CheY-like chemotaxis protein